MDFPDSGSELFFRGLSEGSPNLLSKVPKSDLHSHGPLGSRLRNLELWLNRPLPSPPEKMKDLGEMDHYLGTVLRPVFLTPAGFEYAVEAAYRQAVEDGVTRLEMSVDCFFINLYPDREIGLIRFLQGMKDKYSDRVDALPELGVGRNPFLEGYDAWAHELVETGFFKSLDLYGEELAKPPEYYRDLYRKAGKLGMKRKAHSGEFGDAESVRHTVDVLELDAVQHGISAAVSQEVMNWLRINQIPLNICPTSNVALSRVSSLKAHPIRILYDQGVSVTINTDDLMIFGKSVSEEYLGLYTEQVFNAQELNDIRLSGLNIPAAG